MKQGIPLSIIQHKNSFIGIVDILGYSNQEHAASAHGTFFQEQVFQKLDSIVKHVFGSEVEIHRYGDGYVFASKNLNDVVIGSNFLIAQSLTQYIPLRVAITQGDLTVSKPEKSGLTVSGKDWVRLMNLEKKLDCMGGLVHLPQLDGSVYPKIQKLISETRLIKTITNGITPGFQIPLKEGHSLHKDKFFFLNWQKPLQLKSDQFSLYINSWWNGFPSSANAAAADDTVKNKQENTIQFGDYCVRLHDAVKLSWNAGLIDDYNIGSLLNDKP